MGRLLITGPKTFFSYIGEQHSKVTNLLYLFMDKPKNKDSDGDDEKEHVSLNGNPGHQWFVSLLEIQ